MKGVNTWPNHVYTLLGEMEGKGLLKSRWTDGRKVPRRHFYSLSQSGRREYDKLVEDALGIIMERFFEENLSPGNMSYHIKFARDGWAGVAKWSMDDAFTLVIASPDYDPLTCFPKSYYTMSLAYPNSSVYVVKSPWRKPLEGRKNLTFIDGSRDDIPLRDSFADYVLLQGFPNSSSVQDTIKECLRVLKDGGCLFVWLPTILTVERGLPHNSDLPEYVLKLFYDISGQDRRVSSEEVSRVLSTRFKQVKNLEAFGMIMFYAFGKRATGRETAPAETRSRLLIQGTEMAKS